jgi:hypothetical protein
MNVTFIVPEEVEELFMDTGNKTRESVSQRLQANREKLLYKIRTVTYK